MPVRGVKWRTGHTGEPATLELMLMEANNRDPVATPTAGVFTKAKTVSLVVWIFKPDGIALVAASVKPEHTTITCPAATLEYTVITISPPANADDEVVAGETMVHLSTA